jgi:hypothetical protein
MGDVNSPTIEPEREHDCPQRPRKTDAAEGPRPAPAYWGEAITQIGFLGGRWWAISGREPAEYATAITYCPWCGIALEAEQPATGSTARRRRRLPDGRQENDLSREEMSQLGSRGPEEPRFRRKRPRGAERDGEDKPGHDERSQRSLQEDGEGHHEPE